MCAAGCWRCSISSISLLLPAPSSLVLRVGAAASVLGDTNRRDEIIKKAGSVEGLKLETVLVRWILDKQFSIMDND